METLASDLEQRIIDGYRTMVITGEKPLNSFTLSTKLGITEKEFFSHFSAADDVGRRIWAGMAQEVIDSLNNSEEAKEYTALNKILAYYFTYFEVALAERSFIEATAHNQALVRTYRDKFKEWLGDVIQEGIAMEEIVERLTLGSYYPNMLWQLHLRLLNYWLHDTSEHFVETEKAIEIYSKLPLELMQHNLLDSVLETVKFGFSQLKPDNLSLDRLNLRGLKDFDLEKITRQIPFLNRK
jgi:Tetracyclin repressor-like, C-terminal domain